MRPLIALNALAVVVCGFFMERSLRGYPKEECRLHSQLTRPVLALELVHNAGELKSVLPRDRPPERVTAVAAMFRRNTRLDRVLIFLYVLLLVLFLVLIAGRRPGRWRLLMWLGIAGVLVAGIADWIEDDAIVTALDATALDDGHASAIRMPALIKWGFLSFSFLVIGIILLFGRRQSPFGTTGSALLGLAVLAGVGAELLFPWYPPAIESGTTILFVALLPAGLILPFVRPRCG